MTVQLEPRTISRQRLVSLNLSAQPDSSAVDDGGPSIRDRLTKTVHSVKDEVMDTVERNMHNSWSGGDMVAGGLARVASTAFVGPVLKKFFVHKDSTRLRQLTVCGVATALAVGAQMAVFSHLGLGSLATSAGALMALRTVTATGAAFYAAESSNVTQDELNKARNQTPVKSEAKPAQSESLKEAVHNVSKRLHPWNVRMSALDNILGVANWFMPGTLVGMGLRKAFTGPDTSMNRHLLLGAASAIGAVAFAGWCGGSVSWMNAMSGAAGYALSVGGRRAVEELKDLGRTEAVGPQ